MIYCRTVILACISFIQGYLINWQLSGDVCILPLSFSACNLPFAPPDLGSRSSHTPAVQPCRPFSLEQKEMKQSFSLAHLHHRLRIKIFACL